MKVVVAGGGSVGRFTAEQLAAAGHDVVVVENDRAVVRNYAKEEESKVQMDETSVKVPNLIGILKDLVVN